MDLMEYQARELFEAGGITVPSGVAADSAGELARLWREKGLSYPAVVKAQVRTGGRGKAGGIKTVKNEAELMEAADAILGMTIKGHAVKKVMAAERVEAARELYLSVLLDRNRKARAAVFSPKGGMDIEETAKTSPGDIYQLTFDPMLGEQSYDAAYFASKAGFDKPLSKQLAVLLQRLYALSVSKDCMLAEINPLAVTADGRLVALDAKISVDDSGLACQPEIAVWHAGEERLALVREAESFNFLYIPCEAAGHVAVMSNGSGMLMSCMDNLAKRGTDVCAVLDMGGGATAERISEAIRILFGTPNMDTLFIYIFGGITRCDEVAGGIRAAVEKYGVTKPIVARFEGTNREQGLRMLEGLANVRCAADLAEGIDLIVGREERA